MNTILAAVSEPAPAGQSSSLGIAIILVCLATGIALAVLAAIRGGGGPKPPRDGNDPS